MKASWLRATVLGCALALAGGLGSGCQLIVDFDRSRIVDDAGVDGGSDSGTEDGGTGDSGTDGGTGDSGMNDGGTPTCTDTVQNGMETDVDCGGPTCGDCANGDMCAVPGDCTSGVCSAMTCVAATPTDGMRSGMETDVDCGGPDCADCADGDMCAVAGDLFSCFCNPRKLCAVPT